MRSSAVVAVGTALSRLTGFVRIAAIAYALGVTALAGTYSYANETPNIVYELLLGGVFTATLVPLFVKYFESDDEDAASAVTTVSMLALLAVTVLGVLFAPLIVRLYTLDVHGPGRANQQELATELLRLFMPQMLFYGIVALATAMLNAQRRFVAAAFAPILNNVVVIAVFLMLPRIASESLSVHSVLDDDALVLLMGVGTTAGRRGDGARVAPRAAARACPPPVLSRVAPRRRPHDAARRWMDGRVRDREPGRALRRDRARGRHQGWAVRLHGRVRVLPAAARPVRGVVDDHVLARARARRRHAATSPRCASQLSRALRRHDRGDRARGRALHRARAPADRHAPPARRVLRRRRVDRRRHARRVRGRARAVLDLPVLAARVHVAPRHLHAVLDQLHRERDQHRAGVRASTRGSACPGSRSRSHSPTSAPRCSRSSSSTAGSTASKAARSRPPW